LWLAGCIHAQVQRSSEQLDFLAITRLDILDQMPKIKMCVGYTIDGVEIKQIPASLKTLAKVQPVYEEFNGWMADITKCRNFDELPANAKKYVQRISEVAGVPLGIVSVGPNRSQTIVLHEVL
jgi:adenylosuccinate synthase